MNCWKYAWFFQTLRDSSDRESPSCATRETIALRAVSIGVSYIIFHRLYNRIFLLQKHRILPIIVEDRQFYLYPLSCRSVLGPRAALRSCAEIPLWRYREESIWPSAGTKDGHVCVQGSDCDRRRFPTHR